MRGHRMVAQCDENSLAERSVAVEMDVTYSAHSTCHYILRYGSNDRATIAAHFARLMTDLSVWVVKFVQVSTDLNVVKTRT